MNEQTALLGVFARPGLPSFDYVRATAPDDAIELLQAHGPEARLLMGGTDLFPALRRGALRPRVVVDVKALPGMGDIVYDRQRGLRLGAAVSMNEIARHPDVRAHYPLLVESARSVASYQIRNRATVGGNLCNASPCADCAPAALVLDAELVVYGPAGERRIPCSSFFLGPGKTALQPDELLAAIHFPPPPSRGTARYLKLGRHKAGDLSLVGVAVYGFAPGAGCSEANQYEFRIGLGSVAPTPIRAVAAEAFLATNQPGKQAFLGAAEKAMAAASPITDVRSSADYQRSMVGTLTERGLHDVWKQLQTGQP